MKEMELIKAADRHGWKYVWLSEHHALPEYSHLSANEAVPATSRRAPNASTSARASSTSRRASTTRCARPRRSPCSTTSRNRRFEFGTGRGAGQPRGRRRSTSTTRPRPRASTTRCCPRSSGCGSRRTTPSRASTSARHARTTSCPSPTGRGHPAIWRAVGSPGTWKDAGELGHRRARLHVLVDPRHGPAASTPTRKRSPTCTDPVGQFKNDNAMITSGCAVLARPRQGPPPGAEPQLHHHAGDAVPRHVPAQPAWRPAGPTRRRPPGRRPRRDAAARVRPVRHARGDLRTAPALRRGGHRPARLRLPERRAATRRRSR